MSMALETKKYQIYGVGNALVDYEIETTSQELAELGVEKGVMTLIDAPRQAALFQAFHGKHHARACGGSAANTIIGAQSLGSQCFYSCKVADDERGHFYRDDLVGHGVDSNLQTQPLEQGVTGQCLVLISEDADRTMNTYLGITGDIDYEQIDEAALANSEWLYVEGYLAGSPRAMVAATRAMQFARAHDVRTAFSLSDPNMVKFCREGLAAIIGEGVDMLFCNEDEALAYSEQSNVKEAVKKLAQWAQVVIVTLGAKGALVYAENKFIEIPGHPVEAVDTNGAGDLFAGSFLHAVSHGADWTVAGELASFASALLVTEFGPRLKPAKLNQVRAKAGELVGKRG